MRRTLNRLIDRGLDRYLPKESQEPKLLHKAMRYSMFPGGKRIRPVVLIESSAACGGNPSRSMAGACAVEMVHAYSLIHDDLPSMDDDDFRRGRPSCHKVFGEAMAILAGDGLLTLAFNVIAKNYEPALCGRIVEELSDAIGTSGMVGGQALDITFAGRGSNKKMAGKINMLKTAKLFEASARIGGICAGAGIKKVNALGDYGSYLGRVFQITDDIIDKESLFSSSNAVALADRSKKALKIFGKRGARLEKTADLVLSRTK